MNEETDIDHGRKVLLIRKYISSECNPEELNEAMRLIASGESDQLLDEIAMEIWDMESDDPMLSSKHTQRSKRKLLNALGLKQLMMVRLNRQVVVRSLGVAAIIILGFFLSVSLSNTSMEPKVSKEWITKQCDPGEKLRITLPDGSTVKLNSGTRVTYPPIFSEKERMIILEGEAFFEVERDTQRPFIVHSKKLKTRVLGTSFNISAYHNKEHHITVESGKVSVEYVHPLSDNEASHPVIIHPDEQAILIEDSLVTREVEHTLYTAWKEGSIIFDNANLEEVKWTLEQWYGVSISIELENVNRCIIKSRFNNEKLDNVLNSIGFMLDAEVKYINPKTVVISGKGC